MSQKKVSASDNSPGVELKPVDLLLYCPNCFEQHVDEPNGDVCQDCGHHKYSHEYVVNVGFAECTSAKKGDTYHPDTLEMLPPCPCKTFTAWLNPPHKSHRCNFCNHVWRPADVPTNGVIKLETSGSRDGSPRPVAFANGKDFQDAVEIATRTVAA